MTITYVCAFLNLYEDRSKDKSVETCFNHFQRLASSGINLHVFISEEYLQEYGHLIPTSSNIHIETFSLYDLQSYKELQGIQYTLPPVRTGYHDTEHFMIMINGKIELVQKAIDADIYKSSHFAWIDFSICHVLRNWDSSCKYLQMLSSSALKDKCLVIPGCWNKSTTTDGLFNKINWRFCGGFFLGDRESVTEMYQLYRNHYANAVKTMGILPWEVSMWHYFEINHNWKPNWYLADHNDTIIRVPFSYFKTVASLTTIPSRVENECRKALDSLIGQVDKIYLSIATNYKRFGEYTELPAFFQEEPYKSSVQVVRGPDFGPATKYLGALAEIPDNSWIFFCDDDQEYATGLLERMSRAIDSVAVYQNHYSSILQKTSGGLIHGYVGAFIHTSLLGGLATFPLPEAAYFVDDQWMSIYCYLQSIPIHATNIDSYHDIFKVLDNNHEKWGSNSLSGLKNRDEKVREVCDFFKVRFCHEEGTPHVLAMLKN